MKRKLIRITESELKNIIENTVKRIVKEDFYSMDKPYGRRKLSDYSSDDSKKLHDYDNGFGIWQKHNFGDNTDTFEPAPLGNIPNNEPEFPENDQPYQYWSSLRNYEDRQPIEPSQEDKEYQNDKSWRDINFASNWKDFDYADEYDTDYNFNTHPDAFDASGAKGRVTRLDAFNDTKQGNKARRFNGTLKSLRNK